MRLASALVSFGAVLLTAGVVFASTGHESDLGHSLPLWSVLPFVGMLLSIAILPLVSPHWWEHNKNRGVVAALWGLPVLIWGLLQAPATLGHTAHEYLSFIVLIGSLFIVSGGIFLSGDIRATPRTNTAMLLIGGVIANLIGTTGAAMLLIRPLLRINSERQNTKHVPVFFTFAVANVGGCLLPIGDPPLFMGFLKGVPFFWTLTLLPMWALALGLLLTTFYVWDSLAYAGETTAAKSLDETRVTPLRLHGKTNLPILVGIVVTVAFVPTPFREAIMVGLAGLSLKLTPLKGSRKDVDPRKENSFSWAPIIEVAVLFSGIFTTMIPALMLLHARGGELGVSEPWHFYFATGSLSSFLDNAPTYLVFLSLAQGLGYTGADAIVGVAPHVLAAISCGAVFFGAMTYIGNAPNFMVKSITEESGLKMPSFFGYMLWAVCILLPIFTLVAVAFFGLKPF